MAFDTAPAFREPSAARRGDPDLPARFYRDMLGPAFPDPDVCDDSGVGEQSLADARAGGLGVNAYRIVVALPGDDARGAIGDYPVGPDAGIIGYLLLAPENPAHIGGRLTAHPQRANAAAPGGPHGWLVAEINGPRSVGVIDGVDPRASTDLAPAAVSGAQRLLCLAGVVDRPGDRCVIGC